MRRDARGCAGLGLINLGTNLGTAFFKEDAPAVNGAPRSQQLPRDASLNTSKSLRGKIWFLFKQSRNKNL